MAAVSPSWKRHAAFNQTGHRPWPLPDKPWQWRQCWRELAFIHFEADVAELRALIPKELELDTFDGKAWIGIVPFTMTGVTKRGFPAPAFLSDFPEINVRTYVRYRGKVGVWFFSLDATNSIAVWAARQFYNLPYFKADIRISRTQNRIDYFSARGNARFEASYEPQHPIVAESGSFEAWATERYCLYSQSKAGALFRAEVHHVQWPLQKATVQIRRNNLSAHKLGAMHPSVLYSEHLDVVFWSPERLG